MGLYKSRNITAARRTADKWFGLYIRLRDLDPETNRITCITCKREFPFGERKVDCSHWIEASIDATRYDEFNANAACKSCNLSDNGMAAWHGKEIALKFGPDVYEELLEKSREDVKLTKEEVMEIAREYKQKAEEMAKIKGVEI